MTSKNSFWVNRIENVKRRLVMFTLAFLGNLFVYPTLLLVYFSRVEARFSEGYITENVFRNQMAFATTDALCFSVYSFLLAAVLAVVIAVQGYAFLFHKNKEDMYYSVPISMKKRFWIIFENGVGIYVVTSLVSLLFAVGIALFHGAMTWQILGRIGLSYVTALLFFLVMYSISLLGVMLTGTYLYAGFAIGILTFYCAAWDIIINQCRYMFFERAPYYMQGETSKLLSRFGSVVQMLEYACSDVAYLHHLGSVLKVLAPVWVTWIVISVLLCGISYWLYKKRPTEAAGGAIAFASTRPVLEIALVLPCALFCGALTYSQTSHNLVMMLVAMVVAAFLAGFCLEAIFESDIKAFYCHLAPTVVALVVSLLVICAYQFDWFNYDSYVPEPEEIESYAVCYETWNNVNEHWVMENGTSKVVAPDEYVMKHMYLTDTEAICALANRFLEASDLENPQTLTVLYRLKNGRKVSRLVEFDMADEMAWPFIARIFGTEEYIDGNYQIANYEEIAGSRVFQIQYNTNVSSQNVTFLSAEKLCEAWEKDCKARDLMEQLRGKMPIGKIDISFESYRHGSFFFYEGDKHIIDYLQANGLAVGNDLLAQTVNRLYVTNYHNEERDKIWQEFEENRSYVASETVDAELNYDVERRLEEITRQKEYVTRDEIEEIVRNMIPRDFVDEYLTHHIDDNYEIAIVFDKEKLPETEADERWYTFIKGKVPDFVVEDTRITYDNESAIQAE